MDALKCPKCKGGVAYPTFADENGTNYKCLYCGHGFTQAASKKTQEGSVELSPRVYPPTVPGEPGLPSIAHNAGEVHSGTGSESGTSGGTREGEQGGGA